MKRLALLLAAFCVGLLAASFAFADNGGGPRGRETSTSTSSTNREQGDKRCRNLSLKGTAPVTTFTMTVEKANHAGRDLKSASLTFSGKVSVNARICAAAAGSAGTTLELRNLKVAGSKHDD